MGARPRVLRPMEPRPPTPHRDIATVTIVGRGRGRVGSATASALRAAGIRVHGPTGRGETVPAADVVLLCVPDDQITAVAARIDAAGPVGHMSGATALTDAVTFGIHPLQTFAGGEGAAAFRGIGGAIAGRTPDDLAVARELAVRLGATPFVIDDAQRAAYHAAASIASNYVLTLLAAAEEVARAAGLDAADARGLLAPLVRRTVENWAVRGPADALTGPVARGDEQTVARQRAAVAAGAPDVLALFDAALADTRALAARADPKEATPT